MPPDVEFGHQTMECRISSTIGSSTRPIAGFERASFRSSGMPFPRRRMAIESHSGGTVFPSPSKIAASSCFTKPSSSYTRFLVTFGSFKHPVRSYFRLVLQIVKLLGRNFDKTRWGKDKPMDRHICGVGDLLCHVHQRSQIKNEDLKKKPKKPGWCSCCRAILSMLLLLYGTIHSQELELPEILEHPN